MRNDLYVTLSGGVFERGSKSAQKNVEVRAVVVEEDGKLFEVS